MEGTMTSAPRPTRTRGVLLVLVGIAAGWSLVMLIVPAALQLPLAVGHAQFHALFAAGVLLPAAVLAWRNRQPTLASIAPVSGLLMLAYAQMVDSVGGLGYGPDNDGRVNALANVHDLAQGLVGLGLMGVAIGVGTGIGTLVAQRTGRRLMGLVAAALAIVVGGFGAMKLVGM
jgi:hypothetical protein